MSNDNILPLIEAVTEQTDVTRALTNEVREKQDAIDNALSTHISNTQQQVDDQVAVFTEQVDSKVDEVSQFLLAENLSAMSEVTFKNIQLKNNTDYLGAGYINAGKTMKYGVIAIFPGHIDKYSAGKLSQFHLGYDPVNVHNNNYVDIESSTAEMLINIDGVITTLSINERYNRAWAPMYKVDLVDYIEQGTRTYNRLTGEVIDYATDVALGYDDVAPSHNEAVHRAFEGVLRNDDFRHDLNNGTPTEYSAWQYNPSRVTLGSDGVWTIRTIGEADTTLGVSFIHLPGRYYRINVKIVDSLSVRSSGMRIRGTSRYWTDKFITPGNTGTVQSNIGHHSGETPQLGYVGILLSATDAECKVSDIEVYECDADGNRVVDVLTERVDYSIIEQYHRIVKPGDPIFPNGLTNAIDFKDFNGSEDTVLSDYFYEEFPGQEVTRPEVLVAGNNDELLHRVAADSRNKLYRTPTGELVQVVNSLKTYMGTRNGEWELFDPLGTGHGNQGVTQYMRSCITNLRPYGCAQSEEERELNNVWTASSTLQIIAEPYESLGVFTSKSTHPDLYNKYIYGLPVLSVPRFNLGAYHPLNNPAGCARVMDADGNAVMFGDSTMPNLTKRQCFLNAEEAGDIGRVADSGFKDSTFGSGRPDNTFADTVNRVEGYNSQREELLPAYPVEDLGIEETIINEMSDGTYIGEEKPIKTLLLRGYDTSSTREVDHFTLYHSASIDDRIAAANESLMWTQTKAGDVFKVYSKTLKTYTKGIIRSKHYQTDYQINYMNINWFNEDGVLVKNRPAEWEEAGISGYHGYDSTDFILILEVEDEDRCVQSRRFRENYIFATPDTLIESGMAVGGIKGKLLEVPEDTSVPVDILLPRQTDGDIDEFRTTDLGDTWTRSKVTTKNATRRSIEDVSLGANDVVVYSSIVRCKFTKDAEPVEPIDGFKGFLAPYFRVGAGSNNKEAWMQESLLDISYDTIGYKGSSKSSLLTQNGTNLSENDYSFIMPTLDDGEFANINDVPDAFVTVPRVVRDEGKKRHPLTLQFTTKQIHRDNTAGNWGDSGIMEIPTSGQDWVTDLNGNTVTIKQQQLVRPYGWSRSRK